MLSSKLRKYLILILSLGLVVIGIYLIDEYPVVKYVVFDKIYNYLFVSNHTLDSGAFRNFTTRIGFNIGFDNVLGVGTGQSYFYMHMYEYKMGILNWGETLSYDSMPQNFYSMLFAESSFLGVICYALLFFYSVNNVYKNMRDFFKLYISFCLFTIFCFFSLTPYYSLLFVLPTVIFYGAIKSKILL